MQLVTDSFLHGSAAISNYSESEGILGPDGLRISQVSYVKRYLQKGIMGTGELQLQYCYTTDDEITFVGYELFSGGISDRRGSFILDTAGSVNIESGVISANQSLSKGSCSTEFMGFTGKGSYVVAKNGYCSFEFTIDP